jgi:hypothetical protein
LVNDRILYLILEYINARGLRDLLEDYLKIKSLKVEKLKSGIIRQIQVDCGLIWIRE